MPKSLENQTQNKIKSFAEISQILETFKKKGAKVVQCHGVFDLLHPGHFRHFREAKAQGECLVVTVTPDRFVNKGPGRPVFTEMLRLESLAALEDVDYVVLLPPHLKDPDYDHMIKALKPAIIATTKGDVNRNNKERQANLVNADIVDVVPVIADHSTTRLIEIIKGLYSGERV